MRWNFLNAIVTTLNTNSNCGRIDRRTDRKAVGTAKSADGQAVC